MRRTRKWAFIAQEAKRLAELGLSPQAIADRLQVQRTTVSRWMKAGKLADTRQAAREGRTPTVNISTKPSEWAAAVRKEFALDATDDQLVTMAEAALGKALDPLQSSSVQLQAMRTFQGLVKQLALVARSADVPAQKPEDEKPKRERHLRVVRRPATDPRLALMAVSE